MLSDYDTKIIFNNYYIMSLNLNPLLSEQM